MQPVRSGEFVPSSEFDYFIFPPKTFRNFIFSCCQPLSYTQCHTAVSVRIIFVCHHWTAKLDRE